MANHKLVYQCVSMSETSLCWYFNDKTIISLLLAGLEETKIDW